MTLPTGVGTGTINGRFVLGVIDSPYDDDNDPELIPAQGRITFVPNIPYDPFVPDSVEGVPMTILRASITGVLDSEGYLCTPDDSSSSGFTRGVKLFSTDTGMVTNWTYTVKYSFSSVNNSSGIVPDHSLSVPNGSIQDLTTIVRVPSSPGIGIPQMEASVLRAESVARSVREDADAGVFDGDKGDVGPMGPPVALEIGTVTASAGNPADDDIMSTLILSGTKTKAAIKAQIPIEQIGEQGPKGDPGGWDVSHLGPGTDLNALTVPGVYSVGSASYAKIANGFPIEAVCYVEVLSSGTTHVQRVTVAGGGSTMKVQYERRYNGSVWESWRTFTSTRVDNTAGKAIYQWDDTAGREQMIYGDTGLRDITGELVNGWTVGEGGWVRVRRYGSTVTYYIKHLIAPATGSAIFLSNIPLGFMSNLSASYRGVIATSSTSVAVCTYRRFEQDIQIPINVGVIGSKYDACAVSFEVDSAWPTTLPGTPA